MGLLKGLLKFSSKYHSDAMRYERRGKLSRILTIIFTPIGVALGIGCIYYAKTIESNILLKVFAMFAAFIFSMSCVGNCGVYSACGFIFFAWGSLESFANRRKRRKELKAAKKLAEKEAQQPTQQNLDAKEAATIISDTSDALEKGEEPLNNDDGKSEICEDKSIPSEATVEESEDTPKKKPVSKWLDLFVGIYCLVLAVVGFFGSLIMLLN